MKVKSTGSLDLVKLCTRVLEDKKAGDLRVLDVREQSSITDYLILATGTSEPHLRAMRVELEKALDAAGMHIVGMDAAQESGWLVIDAFDAMVHLFLAEHRQKYGLENLWKDASDLKVARLAAAPRAGKRKRTSPAAPKRPIRRRQPAAD
ncbi:MAG: ribosome silencing factor [Opitutales bacterium]